MPEELLGMVEGIEGVGITIDIGHANTVGKVPEFLPFLKRAAHLHVHDNHGVSDEHLALGKVPSTGILLGHGSRKIIPGCWWWREGRLRKESPASMW